MLIREAITADAAGIANVKVNSWKTTYKGLFPDEVLDALSVEEETANWARNLDSISKTYTSLALVAESDDKEIVGIIAGRKNEDRFHPYDCNLSIIYILKEYQRKKLGSRLTEQIVDFFIEKRFKTMIIWILKGNPNCLFYEKLGGMPKETKRVERWGIVYEEIGYVWEDISKIF
ncbi:MAG: GNAT family N-acetyltransferase [Candidatus Heimdallarchaeota archaeon]|nr:GNAT family N-acetyltransferase [Candidatus Heimdallarchaeota archaeon]